MIGPRDEPPPVLAILSCLAADDTLAEEAAGSFASERGGLDLAGEPEPFEGTAYYEQEMGAGLVRRFWSCTGLVPADALAGLKEAAWEIEQRYLKYGKRRVNLDPGLLDHSKVTLASFKVGPQKMYMGRGVWADMVLYYANGEFTPLRWTFPDLRGGAHQSFFTSARQRYKELLRVER